MFKVAITALFILTACKTEYFKVVEVLGCQGEKCRVVLDNGKQGFVYGFAMKGDTVWKDTNYHNLYRIVME